MLSILKSIKVGWTLLFEKGSRFKMILAGTLMAFALVFPFVMGVYLPVAMRDLTAYIYGAFERDLLELIMAYILALVFGVLVTLPAFGWFITYCWQTYSRCRYSFVDIERPKKGRYGYFRNLFAGALLLLRPTLCVILFQVGYWGARVLSEIPVTDGVYIPMIAYLVPFWSVALALSVLFMWLTNRGFLTPYYYGRGMTVFASIKKSREVTARYPFYADGFMIIFGIAAALSAISVGVLFMLMVLPLMMFTYFSLAEHLDGKKLLED